MTTIIFIAALVILVLNQLARKEVPRNGPRKPSAAEAETAAADGTDTAATSYGFDSDEDSEVAHLPVAEDVSSINVRIGPIVNIDGTPMMDDFIDVHGNAFGQVDLTRDQSTSDSFETMHDIYSTTTAWAFDDYCSTFDAGLNTPDI